MKICPFCASEYIIFSKKKNKYFCEDCEKSFDTPSESKGMRIFLSYGHDKNAVVVQKIKDYLIAHNYDVWIDTSEIPAGKDWRERITSGLVGSNGVLAFLTKHSVRDPGVCLNELKIAVCFKNAYVKTVLLESPDEVNPPALVCHNQWVDMSDWAQIGDSVWEQYFAEKMQDILSALESDEAVTYNEELEHLAKRLGVSDNSVKQQRLLKQTFVGRDWLTEEVERWLEAPSHNPFALFGVPGSGKSAFSANLAQFNPRALASVFFEWDHQEFKSVDTVIKYTALKLATTLSDYRKLLCKMLVNNEEHKKLGQYHGAALFDYLIINPLHCCIDDSNRETGMIIIDGLDETTDEIADLFIRKAEQLWRSEFSISSEWSQRI